jgi:polysaccharide deacetylase 2 family uncharacterized protein YibQ
MLFLVVKNPKSKQSKSSRKKPVFEDGIRAALIAGVIICALVVAGAGFFAVRAMLDFDSPPALSVVPETDGSEENSTESGAETPWFLEDGVSGTEGDILPELEDAIRRLETESGESAASAGSEPAIAARPSAPAASAGTTASASTRPPGPIFPPERRGILVFVIDDAGNNLSELDPFLRFPGPLTIAVLPGLSNSAEAAKRVRNAKKELFLHQPMESLGGQNPGPGAILTAMNAAEINRIVNKNLDELWPVTGLNNHEGSKATMDTALVKTVLELCRARSICFLDSRTIAESAAPGIAASMGFSIAERDVFLDNEQDRESILAAIAQGCKRAERNGLAIMIGHAWSPRLAAILIELYPSLVKKGFYFATVSAVLDAGK